MFDWITGIIAQLGYAGVAFLMFAENVFPPIPSELIMPLAGFNAARGEMSVAGVLLAGVAGSVAGVYLWYAVGRRIGSDRMRGLTERHGRWLTLTPEEFDRAEAWFERHGPAAVAFGRLLPTVRTLISVPAGVARMGRWRFLIYTTLGTTVWNGFLTAAGYLLESQYERVQAWLNPVSTAVVIGLVAFYLYRVFTYKRRIADAADTSA